MKEYIVATALFLALAATPVLALECPNGSTSIRDIPVYMTAIDVFVDVRAPSPIALLKTLKTTASTKVARFDVCTKALIDARTKTQVRANGAGIADVLCKPCGSDNAYKDHMREVEARRAVIYNRAVKQILESAE